MAIRQLKINGDSVLRKKAREVDKITGRIKDLITDMKDTMYLNEGVGLAAPQVGILKRVIVVDVGDEDGVGKPSTLKEGAIVLINPEIIEQSGSQIATEGCLSVPGASGDVERPDYIKVKGKDENFEDVEFEAQGFFARALCHEIDHLDGILYIDKLVKED